MRGMDVWRAAVSACKALVLVSTCLAPPRAAFAAPDTDDLGVAASAQPDASQKARDWLGKDCTDTRILYYVDQSAAGVFKVRNRLRLGEVLDVRLHHLKLGGEDRWTNRKTVYSIEFSPDVRREAKRLGVDLVGPLPFSAWAQLPDGSVYVVSDLISARRRDDPTPPPLPGEFNGVTLEQALDQVAEKLHTRVVVGECDKPLRIDIVSF